MSKRSFFQSIDEKLEREFNVQETLSLLKSNISIYWSWGVSKLLQHESKTLMLQVNGYNHKGWVMVTLGWNDTYTFRLLNGQYNEVYKETDVYVDVLRDRIDEKVEKQPNYSY